MSRESYARGFCKAAEAAGVDPTALAKYAAETRSEPLYKTDGWAPAQVRRLTKSIPGYAPIARSYDVVAGNGAWPALSTTSIQQALANIVGTSKPSDSYEDLSTERANVDPKFRNWLSAHKKALFDAIDESGISRGSPNDPKLVDIAEGAYHQSMLDSTGTPVRVSSQIKK